MATETETEGKTVEQLAAEAAEMGEPESYLEGTSGQLSWQVGGLEPAGCELKLAGGAFEVAGEFSKGEVVELHLTVRVNKVSFDDVDDPDGHPESCVKRLSARVIGAEVMEKD